MGSDVSGHPLNIHRSSTSSYGERTKADASRRDELNAYTFAKRRTLASFLRPSPSGSEEDAPKPLRAVVPGVIVAVVVLAVFGAIGLFSPTAPKGWDEPGAHVIVASDSTIAIRRAQTDGKEQLHPVLTWRPPNSSWTPAR
ncbi:hypothetical protein GCM10023238_12790 [Streptomyces heliomycini]